MEEHEIIFITGGARSGKSSYAENLCIDLQKQQPKSELFYVACGVKTDDEMEQRISNHQKDREIHNKNWRTIEQPFNIHKIAQKLPKNSICLLDCVTTLLTNELFFQKIPKKIVLNHILDGIDEVKKKCRYLIIVSNEVQESLPIFSDLVLTYQQNLGNLHLEIIQRAKQVFLLEDGLAITKKAEQVKR